MSTPRTWVLALSAVVSTAALSSAGWFLWVAQTPLDPQQTQQARWGIAISFLLAAGAAIPVIAAAFPRHGLGSSEAKNPATRCRVLARRLLATLGASAIVVAVFVVRPVRWQLRLALVVNANRLPVDRGGYDVERVPFRFTASFARDQNVYFADVDGAIYRSDVGEAVATRTRLGSALSHPRMLHVSRRGTIFVSSSQGKTVRSSDGGASWQECFAVTCWRMEEEERSGALYAGWYPPRDHPSYYARVLRSLDEGASWQEVFAAEELDHVHAVRWDDRWRRLYIACGDTPRRGQAVSDDGGRSWQWLWRGAKQGHTDVALTANRVVWGSDDYLGRLLIAPRDNLHPGRTVLWAEGSQIWFVVAEERQVFAGTFVERSGSREPAVLLASPDEGDTWQKVLEFRDGELGCKGLSGESRRLSRGGWLYFSTDTGASYRVRRRP